MLEITIEGPPVIQQRPRLGKYGNFYDPSSKERKDLAKKLWTARLVNRKPVLTGDLSLKVAFHYFAHGKRKIDADNMLKALLDSGNETLYLDDSQIQHIDCWKYQCAEGFERTEIQLWEL